MRKVYKAISAQSCHKVFLDSWDDVPKGYHSSAQAALAAYKKPGRPPKAPAAYKTPEAVEPEQEAVEE